jgi:CUG-BP- and ETR3-like factor
VPPAPALAPADDMTNKDLFDLFSPYGPVISARIMVERDSGRSRGFGFISFDNRQSAEAAIRALDG